MAKSKSKTFFIVEFVLSFSFLGCASNRIYDIGKAQDQIGTSLQKTESLAQKAKNDFNEKRLLLENLKKIASTEYKTSEPSLQERLKRMEVLIQDIDRERKGLLATKSDLASLGYSNPNNEELIGEAIGKFEESNRNANAFLLDYSRESNSLADVITQKKLFYHYDLGVFQKSIQKSINAAEEAQEKMLKNIKRVEASSDERFLEQLQILAQEHSDKARHFSEISKNTQDASLSAAKISTLDSRWPDVQKQIAEFEQTKIEVSTLEEKFNRQFELFKNPSKQVN